MVVLYDKLTLIDDDAFCLSLVKAYTSLDGVVMGQHEVLAERMILCSSNLSKIVRDFSPIRLKFMIDGNEFSLLLIETFFYLDVI